MDVTYKQPNNREGEHASIKRSKSTKYQMYAQNHLVHGLLH